MSEAPYSYEVINEYNSQISPSTVHVKNTGLSRFFKRYLLQEAMSVFDWQMPKTWEKNYFLNVLYVIGYIGILNTDAFGVIPQHGGLGGYNVFYQPQYMLITNPLFAKTYRPVIGQDCVCLRLQPDYCGLFDIVDYYGDLMALCAETTGVNLLNSKLSFVFGADNKALAESLEAMPCISKELQNIRPCTENGKGLPQKAVSYKSNVSNRMSAAVYGSAGAESIEEAYELGHQEGAELMRTRYCIRYELGMCPKYHGVKDSGPLFLLNNGQKFSLHFDCRNCEMTVK